MLKLPFSTALDVIEPVIQAVQKENLHDATPCEGWDVQTLLNHMYNELAWVPELLSGKTIEQVGDALDGDLVGDDVQGAWRRFADTARQSVETTSPHKVVHLSYGNVPASAYLDEMAVELAVHAWDLAQAVKPDYHLPEDFAGDLLAANKDKIDGWRDADLVGPEVKVPSDASNELKLLGMFGRTARPL